MPSLAGLRWTPIVTVLNPTSAMTEEKQPDVTEDTVNNPSLKWVLANSTPQKRSGKASESAANNHT